MSSFEVTLTAYSVILVEASNEEEAQELAYEHANMNDFELEGISRVKELKTQEAISQSIRHANQVI